MHLIFGYLGYGNYGDELLASIVESKLEANCPRLSRKNSFREHKELIANADTLIALGGMFQDLSSSTSPLYYFLVLAYAHLCGKRIVLLAQGIGPLHSPLNKLFSYIIFKIANQVSVRDAASSELLSKLKIKHEYQSDLAWSLANHLPEISSNSNTKFIITLRATKAAPKKIAESLKELLLDCDSEPVFLIMQDTDEAFTREIMEQLQISAEIIRAKDYAPQALIKFLKTNFSTMISMRLHALILAHIADLELRAIVCDPKLDGLLEQIKQYDLLELAQRAEDSLSDLKTIVNKL